MEYQDSELIEVSKWRCSDCGVLHQTPSPSGAAYSTCCVHGSDGGIVGLVGSAGHWENASGRRIKGNESIAENVYWIKDQ